VGVTGTMDCFPSQHLPSSVQAYVSSHWSDFAYPAAAHFVSLQDGSGATAGGSAASSATRGCLGREFPSQPRSWPLVPIIRVTLRVIVQLQFEAVVARRFANTRLGLPRPQQGGAGPSSLRVPALPAAVSGRASPRARPGRSAGRPCALTAGNPVSGPSESDRVGEEIEPSERSREQGPPKKRARFPA
jgi:hypothetical protein